MDLHTLIQAQMELMGNDQPVASCGLHGATRRDVIEQAIEYLQKSLANTERDEPSGYGYRINVEIFKKGSQDSNHSKSQHKTLRKSTRRVLLFMTWRANGHPHPNFRLHLHHRMKIRRKCRRCSATDRVQKLCSSFRNGQTKSNHTRYQLLQQNKKC